MRTRPARFGPSALAAAAIVAAVVVTAGCGKKKTVAPVPAPAPPTAAPTITKKPEAPPPPLTAAPKAKIADDFAEARKIVAQAEELRRAGEQIEREKGHEAANDTFVQARKLYRKAVGMTEKWVEPEAPEHEVTQKQVDRDPELKSYADERGSWIKLDSSMGQKLNAR